MYEVTPRDFDVLVRESRARGIDPRDVTIVLYLESAGFNPASAGPGGKGNVNGLNQMSKENLAQIGITPEAWRALSAADQLPRVFRWWDDIARTFRPEGFPPTAGDLAALNYVPGLYLQRGAAANADAALTSAPEPNYEHNVFYDPAKTGSITVNTIRARHAIEATGARWTSLLAGIGAAEARSGAGPAPVSPPEPKPPPSRRGLGALLLLALLGGATWYATRTP